MKASQRGGIYGAAVVFVVLLLATGSVAVFFYYRYQQESSASAMYASEAQTAVSNYNSLATDYQKALQQENQSLTLLAAAVAGINTSTPAYAAASSQLSVLWARYLNLSASYRGTFLAYSIDVLVEPGDGARIWYNGTRVQPGWSMYVATLVMMNGSLQATWYPQYQEHLISGIGNVSAGSGQSWFLWQYSGGGWQVAQVGADLLRAYNGTAYAWTLCGYDANGNPTCTP